MWTPGCHCPPPESWGRTNEYIDSIKGDISTTEAQILFAKFLKANPSYAANLLTGYDLYPIQDIMLRSIFHRDYILGVCARGFSKSFSAAMFTVLYAIFNPGLKIGICSASFRQCLHEDQRVMTQSGWKAIKEVSIGDFVISEDGSKNRITDKWENPPSPLFSLETTKGYGICGKPEHEILIYNSDNSNFEYKKLEEISGNENIVIQKADLFNSTNNQYNADDLYLMGLCLGDAYCKDKYRFHLSTNDPQTVDFIQKYNAKGERNNSIQYRIVKSQFSKDFLNDFSCSETARDKYIPSGVFSLNLEEMACFLSGLFDADGYCDKIAGVGLATSSIRLAQEVQVLLLNFGIFSSISTEKARGNTQICGVNTFSGESYKVRITSSFYNSIFQKLINFRLVYKRNALQGYLDSIGHHNDCNVIPNALNFIKTKYRGKHIGMLDGPGTHRNSSPKRYILKRVLSKIRKIDDCDREKLQDLYDRDYFYDTVKTLEKNKKVGITYDITVENNPSYNAHGFVNHNSKAIFEKIEEFANGPKGNFLKQCIVGNPQHSPDAYRMTIGSTQVVSLPLGSGEKIRGYRFNVMIVDELLLLSEKIIQEVIQPFMAIEADVRDRGKVREAEDRLIAAGKITETDRYKFSNNKFIGLTTASFEFEFLYKLYSGYKESIVDPNITSVSHALFQLSHEAAPKGMYKESFIDNMRKTSSSAQFAREMEAQFTGDSAGYFSAKKMHERTVPPGEEPHIELTGDNDADYVLAIDPNYNDSESSDHFAMCLLKLDRENQSGTVVHNYALSKSSLKNRATYLKYLFKHFNIVYVILDAAGGKKFVQDVEELGDLVRDLSQHLLLMDHNLDNANWDEGVIKTRPEFRPELGKICHAQVFGSNWIRMANEHLAVSIEQGKIWFASSVDAYSEAFHQKCMHAKIGIDELEFDSDYKTDKKADPSLVSNQKQSDFIEHQNSLMKLTKDECSLITVTQNSQGGQRFDLPPELLKDKNKPDRARKDSYSALLLAAWGMKAYFSLLTIAPKRFSGFKPSFVK